MDAQADDSSSSSAFMATDGLRKNTDSISARLTTAGPPALLDPRACLSTADTHTDRREGSDVSMVTLPDDRNVAV